MNKTKLTNKNKTFKLDSTNSSGTETENFDWINDGKNEELLEKYLLFPLREWKEYTYDLLNEQKLKIGGSYQDSVTDVFKNVIFKDENIFVETSKYEAFKKGDNNFVDNYGNSFISSDFTIKNMKIENYKKFLINFSFMVKSTFKIDNTVKLINIIGEIKNSKKLLNHINQKKNYLEFIKKNSNKENQYILMYVFDHSFKSFYSMKSSEENPIIICYMPKLYSEDCYKNFNQILKKLNNKDIQLIDIEKKSKRNLNKNEYFFINVIVILISFIILLICYKNSTIILISFIILLICYIIYLQYKLIKK